MNQKVTRWRLRFLRNTLLLFLNTKIDIFSPIKFSKGEERFRAYYFILHEPIGAVNNFFERWYVMLAAGTENGAAEKLNAKIYQTVYIFLSFTLFILCMTRLLLFISLFHSLQFILSVWKLLLFNINCGGLLNSK